MNDKRKQVEPIPEEFGSYEEAAEFWDTLDTSDYRRDLTPSRSNRNSSGGAMK